MAPPRSAEIAELPQAQPQTVALAGSLAPRTGASESLVRILGDYLSLTKPRLTLLAVAAAVAGYWLGADGTPNAFALAALFIGSFLIGGGANALNQYMERDLDARMDRTRNRPLPAGRLSPHEACCFGAVLVAAGVAYLAAFVGLLTALFALAILASYLFAYTPLKRSSPLSTLVGALPGALPVVMGWAASPRAGAADMWGLFAILLVWQIPHFFAICWLYREDYARAGCPMVPVRDVTGCTTGIHCTWTSLILLVASILPAWRGTAGPVYLSGAIAAGVVFLSLAVRFAVAPTRPAARALFLGSITHLTLMMVLLIADRTPAPPL